MITKDILREATRLQNEIEEEEKKLRSIHERIASLKSKQLTLLSQSIADGPPTPTVKAPDVKKRSSGKIRAAAGASRSNGGVPQVGTRRSKPAPPQTGTSRGSSPSQADLQKPPTIAEKVVEVLKASKEPMSAAEIKEAIVATGFAFAGQDPVQTVRMRLGKTPGVKPIERGRYVYDAAAIA